ncbi:HNH endonuclease family protein [Corynebacterium sp. LK2510]|uniref:HNH endonuclease family protein n=1 Tax=Corynebacterium sp. LK2510 TaxID=3110472 RepID=UPI0034CEBA79
MRFFLALLIVFTVAVAPFPTGRSLSLPAPEQLDYRAKVLGYSREEFGPGWAHVDGECSTRDVAMAAAFAAPSCADLPGDAQIPPITDPYTGEPLRPGDVELDHLVPLAAAWDLGAHAWPPQRRVEFANDPRNLVVTSAAANRAKSDQLPSEWMPPNWRARCAYARQLVAVADTYDLAMPVADMRASRHACSGISGLIGRNHLADG